MSFPQIVEKHAGQLLFTSRQDDIVEFLAGPVLNYEGVCLALVMLWFKQDTSKKDPAKGIVNKVAALQLQNTMETNWAGFATVETQARITIGKTFWWKSGELYNYSSEKYGADTYLQHDPQSGRESLCVFVIYFPQGPAHAIGVWRFPNGTMVLYDPNHGACVIGKDSFREFLNEFLQELYGDTSGYAICAFHS